MCSFMVEHHVAVKKDAVSFSTRARELSQTGQLRRRSLGIAWKLAAPAYGALTDLCPRRLMRALPWRMQDVVGHRRLFPAAWFLCQALISGGHKIKSHSCPLGTDHLVRTPKRALSPVSICQYPPPSSHSVLSLSNLFSSRC